jgi:hypothetical protein
MTDSEVYEFVHLDEERRLFVTNFYGWASQKREIIQWIDKILQDSIQATPVKNSEQRIRNYQERYSFRALERVYPVTLGPLRVARETSFGQEVRQLRPGEEAEEGDIF